MAKKKRTPKAAAPPAKLGRPPKFNPVMLKKCELLAEDGFTNEEIADLVGISVRTLYLWQNQHAEFFHAVKGGKAVADKLVEMAMFRRAIGYNEKVKRSALAFGKVVEWTDIVHHPPDTEAGKFWLMNRQPDTWRKDPQPLPNNNVTLNIKIGHDDDADGEPQPDAAETDPAAKAD